MFGLVVICYERMKR